MSDLTGAGGASAFPGALDTASVTFLNKSPEITDDAYRIDAEWANAITDAVLKVEDYLLNGGGSGWVFDTTKKHLRPRYEYDPGDGSFNNSRYRGAIWMGNETTGEYADRRQRIVFPTGKTHFGGTQYEAHSIGMQSFLNPLGPGGTYDHVLAIGFEGMQMVDGLMGRIWQQFESNWYYDASYRVMEVNSNLIDTTDSACRFQHIAINKDNWDDGGSFGFYSADHYELRYLADSTTMYRHKKFGSLYTASLVPGGGRVGIGMVRNAANVEPSTVLHVACSAAMATEQANDVAAFTTNDENGPYGLRIRVTGSASIANREVELQTEELGAFFNGILRLQPRGGRIYVGDFASPGATGAQPFVVALGAQTFANAGIVIAPPSGSNNYAGVTVQNKIGGYLGGLDVKTITAGDNSVAEGSVRLTAWKAGASHENVIVGYDNIGLFGEISAGGGVGVVFLKNAGTNPGSNPSGGGILYCDSGALKYRGSSGTVTTLGNA